MDDFPMALVNPRAGHVEAVPAHRERSLIDRARDMDAAAWDELYLQHYNAIYRYAFFRVADAPAAEDLAAEVFLQAVRGIQRYRYRGVAFRAWLYRIAHNITADFCRDRSARGPNEPDSEAALQSLEECDFAPALLQRRDIQQAVARLTDEQQQVIILRFFEGLSIAETAEAIGRNAGATKSLQHRALERLRAILGEEAH
jgi:RNA polymerase sigma-70 factor (ECF subfamily)